MAAPNTMAKLSFELTEWEEDGDTRKRHVTFEASVFPLRDVISYLRTQGPGLTGAELAAVQKITDALNELHSLIAK